MAAPIDGELPRGTYTVAWRVISADSDPMNGAFVRWIGPPDSEEPAPQVSLTAAEEPVDAAASGGDDLNAETAAAATETDEGDVGAPTWLALAALIVGALGLMAGGASLVRSRVRHLRRGAGA